MKKVSILFILVLLAYGSNLYAAKRANGNDDSILTDRPKSEGLKWFTYDKFGIMIHWGLFSVPAGIWNGKSIKEDYGEWIMNYAKIPVKEYEQIADHFNPTKFDADKWIKLASEAGMKYLVITAKHHEGFAMYDSKTSHYNLVERTPFARDPMIDIAAACKKYNIKMGFYYSQAIDWHHPGGARNWWIGNKKEPFQKYIDEKALPQIRELLTNYGPLGVLYFDIAGAMEKKEQSRQISDLIRDLQPNCLTNSRLGWGEGDYEEVGDNDIPLKNINQPWETSATLNVTYGYKKTDTKWKTPETIIRQLVHVVSKGGNYLLNIGPTGEGEIPDAAVRIMQEMGKWMKKNSDSIYGTTASPLGTLPWGRCTAKEGKLYLHLFHWPEDGKFIVPGVKNKVKDVYILAKPSVKLQYSCINDKDVLISIPAIDIPADALDTIDTVVVMEIEGKANVDPMLTVVNKNYENVLNAFDANTTGQAKYVFQHYHGRVNSSIENWTKTDEIVSWDFRVVKPGTFDVQMTYAAPSQCQANIYEVVICKFSDSCGKDIVNADRLKNENQVKLFVANVNDTGGMSLDFENSNYLWHVYETAKLGKVTFAEAGTFKLLVRPKQIIQEPLMNLKSVSLIPSPLNE